MNQNAKSEPSTNPKHHDWQLTEDSEFGEKFFKCQKCGYLVSESYGLPEPELRIPVAITDGMTAYDCHQIICAKVMKS